MPRTLLPLAVVVLVLTACDGGTGDLPSPPDSGIHGRVVAGPQCPVVREGSPCPDAPWDGDVRITGEGVDIVVSTFDRGTFAVAIEPGTYEVQPVVTGPATAEPVTVSVPGQGYAEVALTVDTGIR